MTTINEARNAAYERFVSNFTGVTSDRITLENEVFEKPTTGSWLRMVVRELSRLQDTLGKSGNRRFRTTAMTVVQVYTQPDIGVQLADVLAKEAADLFEGVSFSGLDFRSAVIRETGISGKWNQYIVESEFQYDEIK